MEDKVGVFVFDSYFDVFLGIEEKYKRWDLFEAVFRYVRFDQTKRLPAELNKIFKVLKPILDVQKKKLIRNEKRRKTKKLEGVSEIQEGEKFDSAIIEKFGESGSVDNEEFFGAKDKKVIEKLAEETKKRGKNNKEKKSILLVAEGTSEDKWGVIEENTGGEERENIGGLEGAQSVLNKGDEGDLSDCKNLPNGEPNVLYNKNENKIKDENGNEKIKARKLPRNYHHLTGEGEEVEGKLEVPTLGEVREFAEKSRLQVNAEGFYNYYSAKGWVLRGKPMYDWRACMIKWNDKFIKKEEEKVKESDAFEKQEGKFLHFSTSYDDIDSSTLNL